MPTLELAGCRTTPLASYLKALGVLRLVAEQADPRAGGAWVGRRFQLHTSLGVDELSAFLLDDYRPTPLVAPWNGGSGFYPKDRQIGLAALEASSASRLEPYRQAIASARALMGTDRWARAEAGKNAKRDLLQLCRASLPDDVVHWIDAAAVLTSARPAFPPLFGTGGNVGRLEFSNNFMQRLVTVLGLEGDGRPPARGQREAWLRGSLWGEATAGIAEPIGQFDPGGAGGANSGPHGDAGSIVNPWDYVLLMEGALGFSSGAARRIGTGSEGSAATPFMFRSTPTAFASAADKEATKGELWAPVWKEPASWTEVSKILAEGRGVWGKRQAASALDFVRAVATLAVDRGIDSFERFVFAERHGQNMLAVPVGNFVVQERRGVRLLDAVDTWARPLRWGEAPGSIDAALRRLDAAQFEVARESSAPQWHEVLSALAELEWAVGRPRRDRLVAAPVTGLRATAWAPLLDDDSVEWDLASSLASGVEFLEGGMVRTPAHYLRPVTARRSSLEWREQPAVSRHPDVLARLENVLQRRLFEAKSDEQAAVRGVHPGFAFGRPARLGSLVALMTGTVDRQRLATLLDAALLLDWRDERTDPHGADGGAVLVPGAVSVVLPFVRGTLRMGTSLLRLPCDLGWGRLLAREDAAGVMTDMVRRLRLSGAPAAVVRPSALAVGIDPRGVAAGLLCNASQATADRAFALVHDRETSTEED
jgi:CRISPR-associated protein Csx17